MDFNDRTENHVIINFSLLNVVSIEYKYMEEIDETGTYIYLLPSEKLEDTELMYVTSFDEHLDIIASYKAYMNVNKKDYHELNIR